MTPSNGLFYGDNLAVLRGHIASASVDLIYLDPPFQSNRAYNILFAAQDGTRAPAQIQAFDDTWRWDEAAVMAYHETLSLGGTVAEVIRALHMLLGDSDLMAYLAMMAPRLIELHRVLKPTGSLYLHCDPTASHYLKALMDTIFGAEHYRAEIVWKRSSAHNDTAQGRKQYGHIHDTLLFYTKGETWTWNPQYTTYDPSYVDAFYKHIEPITGRRYRLGDLTGPGGAAKGNPRYELLGVTRYWRYSQEKMNQLVGAGRIVQTTPGAVPAYKRYLDEMPGVALQDMWTDVQPLSSQAAERLGYPTQKPLSLLERIINTSSNPGDVVLDPFCGCGTAVDAAQHLGRRWIGIDITHLAINLIKKRLHDRYPDLALPRVVGEPTTVDGAAELARTDPHGFQDWICALAGAQSVRPTNAGAPTLRLAHKKGADRGIDGRLYFVDDASGRAKQIVLSVKSGHLQPAYVRELRGVMEREGAEMAALLTLHEPTTAMRGEAAAAGRYTSPGWNKDYPRLQIVTVAQLLRDERIAYPPPAQSNVTFKRASKAKTRGNQPTPVALPGMESAG